MAVPNELFRVWVEVEVQRAFGTEVLSKWVNVWHVWHDVTTADPIDIAAPFAGWINQGITANWLSGGNVVARYGGRRVAAGGPDAVKVTGSISAGDPTTLLPPQVAVLVLARTAVKRVQSRKWIGGGRFSWVNGNTGNVDDTVPGQSAWWKSAFDTRASGGTPIRPVVWDAANEVVHEIQQVQVMQGFRTQRRRSLSQSGTF